MKDKYKSTTLWLALVSLFFIPASWIVEYFLKLRFLKFMVDHELDIAALEHLFIEIPLAPIVTLATLAISIYGARKAGREITTNLSLPVGQNAASNRPPQGR